MTILTMLNMLTSWPCWPCWQCRPPWLCWRQWLCWPSCQPQWPHCCHINHDLADQVDGGGVQAEVVETDVGASNGVIHSINRVRPTPPNSSFLQNCERLNVVLLNPPPHCKTEFCMHRIPLSTILCNYQLIVMNISFGYERFCGSAVWPSPSSSHWYKASMYVFWYRQY